MVTRTPAASPTAAPTPAPTRKTRLDGLALATLLLCCVLWGLNQVAAKATMADVPPLAQAATRSLGAALLVALWAAWRGIPLSPANGTWRGGLLAGVLFAAEFGCIFAGLQYTTASRMVVFIYMAPFVVALGMPWVAGTERPTAVQLLGLGVAFAGVAAAFSEGFSTGLTDGPHAAPARQWWGDALGVAAAMMWGAATLTVRGTRLATAAPEQTLLYQLAVSGVLLAAASWLAGEHWPSPFSLGWRPLALLLGYQTLVVTFASYLLWFWLVRHYPATRLSAVTLLTPLFGLVAGVVLLGEPLTLRLALAGVAVAVGIALVNRPAR